MEETPSGSKRTGGMYRDMERERGKTERENRPEYVHRVCIAFILIPTRADFGEGKNPILEGAEAEIDRVRKIEGERSQTTDSTG
jgi:hypothetical protein